jgi:hypothetical protein
MMMRLVRSFRAIARAGLVALPMIAAFSLPAAAQEPPPPGIAGPGMGGPGPQDMMHGRPGDGHGPEGMHGGGPLAELARAEADHVASQAVADLAKAPVADVQRMIRAWGVQTVLRYYDVPPKAFHDAVVPGLVALVRAAEQQERISATDADRIVDHVQQDRPHGPPAQ